MAGAKPAVDDVDDLDAVTVELEVSGRLLATVTQTSSRPSRSWRSAFRGRRDMISVD